jgi:hypothetical protein
MNRGIKSVDKLFQGKISMVDKRGTSREILHKSLINSSLWEFF